MRTTDTFWTREEFERCFLLRRRGLTWTEVARQIGRPRGSLMTQLCRYRQGKLDAMLARRDRDQILVQLAEAGAPLQLIHMAMADGTTPQNTCAKLRRRGWDGEVRAEYRDLP